MSGELNLWLRGFLKINLIIYLNGENLELFDDMIKSVVLINGNIFGICRSLPCDSWQSSTGNNNIDLFQNHFVVIFCSTVYSARGRIRKTVRFAVLFKTDFILTIGYFLYSL